MKNLKVIIFTGIILSLFIFGCTKPDTTPIAQKGTYESQAFFNPQEDIRADNFKSLSEFNDFVKNSQQSQGYNGGGIFYGGAVRQITNEVADMAIAKESASPSLSTPEANDFSKTNNQVESVDEGDIIKTDGKYIYTTSGKKLYIIEAYPGEEAKIVSTIKLDSEPGGLFINKNYLAVYGNFYDADYFKEMDLRPRWGMTYFNIYNIEDKEQPELVKEYKFEGNFFQARMYGENVYFVTLTGAEYRVDFPTPLFIEGDIKKSVSVKDIYRYPIPYRSPQFANIHTISLLKQDLKSKSIIVEGSQNMYMSEKNIYITYTEYINEWEITQKITIDLMIDKLSESDKALVQKIKDSDNEVLSQQEKESKILQIVQEYMNYLPTDEQENIQKEIESEVEKKMKEFEYSEYTIINKISVDNGDIDVQNTGKVPGHIINQFSLDEFEGVLRIATTISPQWSRFEKQQQESSNNILTLNENMEVMDSLYGIAEGEQIYSTRFMGERLYMVTFKQVDPFFVFDLSNPSKIEELGKLKIPGFSRYLHPYDENTIIGIGREATDSGRVQGLKISLFDVSDVENPKELAKFVTKEKYASSVAEYEHKAFLFSKEKELLVIPAYNYDYQDDEGYNGAMVFKITKNDIELRGIIDHSKGDKYYGSMVERSLFINELLYTKSPTLLRINKLEDLSKVKNIDLDSSSGPYPVY